MTIFGERIKQAREISSLTQGDLASRAGISQSMVAHIETNRVAPSSEIISALARETDVHISFFEQIPCEDVHIASLAYRARSSLKASEKDQAYQYTKLCVEEFRKMAGRLDLPDLNLPNGSRDPSSTAKLTRIILGAESAKPIPSLINLIERNGVIVFALPFTLEKLDAFSCWTLARDERPLIVVSEGKPGDRLRFSIAHELGHIVLHKGIRFHDNESEREANSFAGELLLPEDAMRAALSPTFSLTQAARLKLRWAVSMQMLIHRAHDLGIITDRRYHYLFEQIGRLGWKKREPENLDIPVEKPRLFKKMVEILYGHGNEVETFAAAAHINCTMAQKILGQYLPSIPRVSLEETEEYISSRQKINPN